MRSQENRAAETAEAGLERSIGKRGAWKSHGQEKAVCLWEMPKGCGWQGEQNAGRGGEVGRDAGEVPRTWGVSFGGVLLDPQALQGPLHLRQGSYKSQISFRKKRLVSVGVQWRRPRPHSPS